MTAIKHIDKLQNGDWLAFRPHTLFGFLIIVFEYVYSIKEFLLRRGWKPPRLFISHVASFIDGFKFEAMEGRETGFKRRVGNCYVVRLKKLNYEKYREYLIARNGTKYDRMGIIASVVEYLPILRTLRIIRQNDFCNYCSELNLEGVQYSNDFEFFRCFDIITPTRLITIALENGAELYIYKGK